MNNELIFTLACTEAKRQLLNEYITKLDCMPDVSIPKGSNFRNKRIIETYLKKSTKQSNGKVNKRKYIKTVIIAAILLILMTTTAFSIKVITEYIADGYEDFDDFSKKVLLIINGYDYLDETYSMPEGYKMEETIKNNDGSITTVYSDGANIITIDSTKTRQEKYWATTGASVKNEVMIGNLTGYYTETGDTIILIWSTGRYSHKITANKGGNLTKEALIEIARSRAKND